MTRDMTRDITRVQRARVLYADRPKLLCATQRVVASIHKPDVTLQCVVRSQPAVNRSEVKFSWTTASKSVGIVAGQRDGHYFADLIRGVRPDNIKFYFHLRFY